MAIREELTLDLSRALSQIDQLESQIDALTQPIIIPVEVEPTQSLNQLEQQIRQVDNDDIEIDVNTGDLNQADRALQDLRNELGLVDNELEDVEDQSRRTGRELEDTGNRGTSAFGKITRAVGLVAGALAAFGGGRALLQFFGDSISAASDVEESLSKVQVVFGEFSDDIEDFAATAPQALGLANSAALEFSGTFGNLFVALGLSQQAAADLAPEIVQLGADLASFNNIEVTDALDKLRAGLVGEAEPLRVLGVNLTAATVEAKALELGLTDATGAVSEAAKVQARYALILEQTATAQGDFARTADSIANRQRTLAADFENLRAAVGEALLPAFESLLDAGPSLIELFEALVPVIGSSAESFAGFADSVVPFLGRVEQITTAVGGLFDAFGVARAPVDATLETLGKLITLDFGGAIDEVQEFGQTIDEFAQRATLRGITFELAGDIAEGADAADELESALSAAIRTINLGEEGFEQLAGVAKLTKNELVEVTEAVLDNAEALGADQEEIRALQLRLQGLRDDLRGGPLELFTARDLTGLTQDLDGLADATLTEADALEILGGVADAAGISLAELLNDTEQLGPEFSDLADQVSGGTLRFLESIDRIDELQNEIGQLPGSMEAAQAALKTSEDEIVTDFTDFFDNLLNEIEAREAFESNLAILRAFGLDALADTFDQAGLEASTALADAVANPQEAADAEAALDGQYAGVADSVVATMREVIESQPVSQALIDNLIAAAALADTPEVRAALLALADSLALEIPVTFGDPGTPTFSAAGFLPEFTGAPGVNVTNNFFTEPNPTTDTARVEQATSSVIGLVQ